MIKKLRLATVSFGPYADEPVIVKVYDGPFKKYGEDAMTIQFENGIICDIPCHMIIDEKVFTKEV